MPIGNSLLLLYYIGNPVYCFQERSKNENVINYENKRNFIRKKSYIYHSINTAENSRTLQHVTVHSLHVKTLCYVHLRFFYPL